MMPITDSGRLLSMSTFEAAFVLRRFRRLNPTYSDEQLVESIRSVRSDFYPNDYEAGLALEKIVSPEHDGTIDVVFFRAAIESHITHHNPLWVRFVTGGREHVLRAVEVNGTQCFRNAGLLDAPPSDETSKWWDELAAQVRRDREITLMDQARRAERLSLEFERARLRSLGIQKEPRWVSIEDNSAGYDILSYDPGNIEPTNRLIEVKSSTHRPPRIFITRSEWEAAKTFGSSYVFQIWQLPDATLVQRTVAEMERHIPADNGLGWWTDVQITFR